MPRYSLTVAVNFKQKYYELTADSPQDAVDIARTEHTAPSIREFKVWEVAELVSTVPGSSNFVEARKVNDRLWK